MKYRGFGKLDWEVSALGFGCMRFPVLGGNSGQIDQKAAAEMLLRAIDGGVNYIDTAYPYHKGESEGFVGKTLQGSYREKVKLATKLPCWKIEQAADFDLYLNEQLERLRTSQIDCYLLHALDQKTWQKVESLGVLSWAEKARSQGRIKHLGFSFHDEFPVFKSIVDAYQGWDLCLIQHNYMDQDYQAGSKGLVYATKRGLAVAIMEPLRGGRLVDPPQDIQAIWDQADAKRSPADWSFQWLWNQPEVSVVLSGMSTLRDVEENLASANRSGINSLTGADLEIVARVKAAYEQKALIPCTNCGYCMPCPEGVDIPGLLAIYNTGIMYEKYEKSRIDYTIFTPESAWGDKCVVCGQCEEACPQHIAIPDWLARIHREYTA